MHFCIRACDISALAGRNTFRPKRVAIRRLVDSKINNHHSSTCGDGDINKKLVDAIRKGKYYKTAVSCQRLTRETCKLAENECKQIVSQMVNAEDVMFTFRRYQHLYLKDRGLVIENIVIERLQHAGHNIKQKTKRERTFSKTFTCESGDHTYTVYGCVDCIEENDSGGSLIEIKSRRETKIKYLHETDQIVTYLIVSERPRAYLVEYVNEEIFISDEILLCTAKHIWNNEIRSLLEKSLHEAAQRILNSLP